MKDYIIDANITLYNNGDIKERQLAFKEFDDVIQYMEQNYIRYDILEKSKYFLILRVEHPESHEYNSSYWHCAKKGVISYHKEYKN